MDAQWGDLQQSENVAQGGGRWLDLVDKLYRRDPDPDGYQFWLNRLNQFKRNFEQAEMVKAIINSEEYRGRFA